MKMSKGDELVKILGWKIRRKSDGKFSVGGMHPAFHGNGKVWSSRAGLHNHFAVVREAEDYLYRTQNWNKRDTPEYELGRKLAHEGAVLKYYGDCEIVAVVEGEAVPMAEYMASIYKPKRRKK